MIEVIDHTWVDHSTLRLTWAIDDGTPTTADVHVWHEAAERDVGHEGGWCSDGEAPAEVLAQAIELACDRAIAERDDYLEQRAEHRAELGL